MREVIEATLRVLLVEAGEEEALIGEHINNFGRRSEELRRAIAWVQKAGDSDELQEENARLRLCLKEISNRRGKSNTLEGG